MSLTIRHSTPTDRHSPTQSISHRRLRDEFVAAMGKVATGVTIVATDGPAGRYAQTVSAMCSVCADPPMVLVCIHDRSPMIEAISGNGAFAVSVLATRHDHVADTFAGRPWPGKDRWDFTCGRWEDAPSGSPRVSDALASFDCTPDQVIAAGTHRIYLGRVESSTCHDGKPLIYTDREYCLPEPVEPSRFPEFPEAHPANRWRKQQ
ncbi:MAG: flavin reductase family protein [Haloechinothrix sp.]